MDGTASSGGDAAGDILSGIEQVIGTGLADTFLGSGADETFRGGGSDDTMTGAAGNDTLYGEAGNDLLNGGLGSDVLDGGAGTDTATYANSALGVAANLADSSFNTNEAAGDTYNLVENVTGSAFNDRLTGDSAANVLDGGTGNDRLAGGAGADSLIGGVGTDTADYSQAGAGIALNLGGGGAGTGTGSGGDASGDTLSGIENVIGSSFADSFTLALGNGFSIDGGGGADSVALAANAGTVSSAQLASVLSRVETIDFTASGANASLTVDSSFIQSVIGGGNASHLTVDFNAGDTLQIANGAIYTQNGSDYTFYSDNSMTTTVAQLTVV